MGKISKSDWALLGITAIFLLVLAVCFFSSSADAQAGYTVSVQYETDWELAEPEKIDINTADAEKLQTLDGIGEMLAERIIARRESVGPYRCVDELLEVEGIGPATVDRIRPWIEITEEDE